MEKTIIFLLATIAICSAETFYQLNTTCPPLAHVANFSLSLYNSGKWYEHRRIPTTTPILQSVRCLKTIHNGTQFVKLRGKMSLGRWGWSNFRRNTTLTCGVTDCTMTIPLSGDSKSVEDFYVIDTDYDNYALVFGCKPLPNDRSAVFGNLLMRNEVQINDDEITQHINTFRELTEGRDILEDHSNC